MNIHDVYLNQTKKMLRNLAAWMAKASAHAHARGFDPNNYLGLRLAPDMYTFTRQVQAACDSAKSGAAAFAGRAAPSHPDTEATFAELEGRVAKVLAYLDTFSAADFAGAEDRIVPLGFMPGKGIPAPEYLVQLAIPNFHFHVTTAYALLRHAGVELGKRDYIGGMPLVDLPPAA